MEELHNHAWNTLGALIRSLKEKKEDGSWDRSYKAVKEDVELYEVEPPPPSSNFPDDDPIDSPNDETNA